jgi:hypothetical protein
MIRSAKRWLGAITSASLMALGLSVVAPAAAQAVPQQSGPFWPGNLLSMNNADLENGVGDWNINSNISTLTTDSTAFLHNNALKIVAAGTGTFTSIIKLTGSSGIQITLPGSVSHQFRVGAYVKMPVTSGHTTEFDLGCYNSSGTWLGWSSGTPVSNNSTGAWQWVEDDIAVPSGCAYVQGSPRVQFTGMTTNNVIHMDEVWFAPYRAALMIGAYAPDAATWQADNASIGPLQSIKVFWGDTQDFQTWSGDPNNVCYGVEQQYPTDHSKWPVCLIAFKAPETEQQIQNFLAGMPTDQTVIFIYHQEPEGDSFSGSCGSGAAEFKCEFEQEIGNVRSAAASLGLTENVFTADDSASFQYSTPDSDSTDRSAGYGCGWIVPPSYADFYLQDHYEHGWADGTNLSVQTGTTDPGYDGDGTQQWVNWLGCVNTSGKPIGLAEYGLCSGGNFCGPNAACDSSASTTYDKNTMEADRDYLKPGPSGTSPTLLWDYWYDHCWVFDNSNHGIDEWQSIENENGGAVGG